MVKEIGYGPNARRKPEERTVMFGKHAGKRYSEVPTSYLKWFAQNAYPQMIARREWAIQELKRREALNEKDQG